MADDTITRADLREAVEVLRLSQVDFRKEMRVGFNDIKTRQDRTNGNVDRNRAQLLEHARILSSHGETMATLGERLRPGGASVAVVDGTMRSRVDDPATIALSVSPKMWALLASVVGFFSLFVPTMVALIEKWVGVAK